MRARTVITRSGARIRGKFPSAKTGRSVHWESLLERDACILLEYSAGIRTYQEQPRKVQVSCAGMADHVQFPDFEIVMADGEIGYVEIKSSRQLILPEVKDRLMALQRVLEHEGFFYKILTEAEIRREPRLSNLSLLFSYRSSRISQIGADLFNRLGSQFRSASLHELTKKLGSVSEVMALLADQYLSFDLDKKLTPNTILTIATGGSHENLLF
ncbi:MAG: hypothetical protein ACRERR_08290 [Moraxellaceae bacterium]